MTKRANPGRLRSLVSGPGVDTRYHICEAVVDAIRVDPDEGVFCDISLLPMEEPETALLGVPYAGANFGFYFPVEEDDIVLVAIPDGDVSAGPVIISRMWSAADPPFSELRGSADSESPGQYFHSSDVVLRAKAGANTKIIVADGANVSISAEGSGNVNITVNTGNVNLKVGSGVVNLGNDTHGPLDGAVHGSGFDSFTGATYTALGNASAKVFVRK